MVTVLAAVRRKLLGGKLTPNLIFVLKMILDFIKVAPSVGVDSPDNPMPHGYLHVLYDFKQ